MHRAHVRRHRHRHRHQHRHYLDNQRPPFFVFFTHLTKPKSKKTLVTMEEQTYQNMPMEFKPLSFAGKIKTESNYMHELSQQATPNYVDYLSQSGLSEIQTLMAYNDQGVALLNNFSFPVNNQEQESIYGYYSRVFRSRFTERTAAPALPSRIRSDASKEKAREAGRRRRAIVSERLKALQELLPQSKEGGKTSTLDDAFDYIKYLQFQLKELSQSRLWGKATSGRFIFLEGCGHYLVQEHMLNEPLEEKLGKLLEQNPSAAIQLLQSKGLYLMPMALVEGLSQGV